MLIPLCTFTSRETVVPVSGAQNCIAQTIREVAVYTLVFLTEALMAKLAARWQSFVGALCGSLSARQRRPTRQILKLKINMYLYIV